jgi:1,4-dihydroxy-2-naphthoate octaprenyltransferase
MNWNSIISLGRFKFLVYSPIMYTLGVVAATGSGRDIEVFRFIQGLLFVWTTHLVAHYCNEYYDLEPDTATANPSPWTGGSRVLVKGLVAPQVALRIAYALASVSLVMGLLMPTPSAKLLCLGTLALAWEYSAPPFRLESRGLGELVVTTVLNVLVPLLGFSLQHGALTAQPLLLVLIPLSIIGYIRMMVMNMADWRSDATTWKKTLVVRIGIQKAVRIHGVGMVAAYLSLVALYFLGVPPAVLALVALTAPLGFWYAARLRSEEGDLDRPELKNIPYVASTHSGLSGSAALFGMILLEPEWSFRSLEFYPLYFYLGLTVLFRLQAHLRQRYPSQAARSGLALDHDPELPGELERCHPLPRPNR